jgi:hypothetical protein
MSGARQIPLWIKIAYSAFLTVMVPIYLHEYGPANFLYFCDVAALITLPALWLESPLLASIGAVGIILPQMIWILDLGLHFFGMKFLGMTDYMFDSAIPSFTRAISLFHGWLPLLLLYLQRRLSYDRRAFAIWTGFAWAVMLVCYFWTPRPGTALANPQQPVNIDYVFGVSDKTVQTWMPSWAWLLMLLLGLPALIWWPTHLLLIRFFGTRRMAR